MRALLSIGALAAVGALLVPADALAQPHLENDQVLVVPYNQSNPDLPHPAHEGARITLKAVVRNATCSRGGADYQVWWDTDRDGDYDDEWRRDVEREGTTITLWDIGRMFEVPNVPRDQSLNINVRVRNRCNGEDKFATFHLFVYDWRPSNDPVNWTKEQIDTMNLMAVQESLWYHHRKMTGFAHRSTSGQMYGRNTYVYTTGIALWQFTINGRLPAYRPGSYNTFNQPVPNGWQAANDARWNADPYAETAMRMTNWLSRYYNYRNINRADEDNTCGYDANRNVRRCNRLANTSDSRGLYSYSTSAYVTGIYTGAMSTVLPALAGTRIQEGTMAGRLYEEAVQQQVDYLGGQQIDGGVAMGGWYYDYRNQSMSGNYSDGSTTQWGYIGLESGEIAGGPYGVFVNNRHKYRIASNIIYNQRGDWKAGYRSTSGQGDTKLTGGAFVGTRWLGIHLFNRGDGTVPFPNETGFNRDRMRLAYDRYVSAINRDWNERLGHGSHWQDGIWRLGDPYCGNRNAVYNAGRCGSTYAMYSLQKGFRTGQPELERIGNHDWYREFSIYYLRAQNRGAVNMNNGLQNYDTFGYIYDEYCDSHSVTCSYGSGTLAAAMGGLVLTPSVFKPLPVAIFTPEPAVVTEGCAGGNAGRVTLNHAESFHPNADARIIAYQYDVDARNGLWWETGANPDVQAAGQNPPDNVVYTFQRAGNYTVTLRVVDNDGQSKTTTRTVTVNTAQNVPPSAVHGGPYTMEEGGVLSLEGSGNDSNLGCGDRITAAWDLDNDNAFDDANGATVDVQWNVLQGLPRGQPVPIRIRVTDRAGLTATEATTLTIFPREPVADGRANPNPAACQQNVTFDGNASFHPNPDRAITEWRWNVDGQAGNEGGGALFTYAYGRYGTYDVTLTVLDDLGRTDTAQFQVVVNQGNGAPSARIERDNYVVLEGDAVTVSGAGSTDPNLACGDRITEYAWDLDDDGAFDDANGQQPEIPWATLAQIANFDAANAPIQIPIALRVTDTFGATHVDDATITLFSALPIAQVVQAPNPAPINLVTGFSRVELDGRESRSPIPNVGIQRYQWDLDDDGVFEVNDSPTATLIKVFNPVPGPADIPAVFVRLRVIDENGRDAVVRYRVNYRVPPTPPTADADPTDPPEQGYHILLGDNLTLDGSQSSDPDAGEFGDFIEFYRWDLSYDANAGFQADEEVQDANGDGQESRLTLTAQQLAAHGVNGAGQYLIAIQVEDTTELTNEDTAILNVYPRNPVARAVVDPNPAGCGQRINFDASASNHPHPDIDVVAWAWDFDLDGQYDDAQGRTAATRFDQFSFGNPRQVGLQVTDSNGNTGTVRVDVDVSAGNRPPVAVGGGFRDGDGNVAGPYTIAVGDPLDLDGAGSADPDAACGDRIESYQWDIGNNGSFDAQGIDPDPIAWAQLGAQGINGAGNYNIRLRVTDRFGVTGDSIVTLRVVNGPNALAAADPNRANCQQVVTFDGAGSSTDGPQGQGFDLVAYEWDFDGDGDFDDGNGARVAVPAVSQEVDNNGDHVMHGVLRVTDESGRTDTDEASVIIDVQNVQPVANAGGPYATGPIGGGNFAPVQLDGRGSRDPNAPCDEIVSYQWDVDGDGRFGADDNPDDPEGAQVAYTNPRWRIGTTQTVQLRVCDAAGACSDPAEAQIQVRAVPPPSGQVLSPRANNDVCLGAGNFDLDLSVAHPAGLQVTATVTAGGVQLAQQAINTNANGNPVNATITINANRVPEGRHVIEVVLTDPNGGTTRINSGGLLTFDRTGPVIQIANALGEGVCYQPNQVPEPDINVQDAFDPAPAQQQDVEVDGCGRTLVVRATDACGNTSTARRNYLLAQNVAVDIDGAGEGELVQSTRMNWDVIGQQECAADITASLARDGGNAQPYPENQLINQGGRYTLTVTVENCAGIPRNTVRSFIVNSPPVSVPVPAGHPATDNNPPAGLNFAYIVDEGDGLQVDGSESLPPEADDEVTAWNWDFDNDGQFDDGVGQEVAFPTDDDGVFRAALQTVDSLGAVGVAPFQVTVRDVSPDVDSGGPYVVDQGAPFQFDASGTRPGSPADPISGYEWNWADGTPNSQGAQPEHTYRDEGRYVARLTVSDEDNAVTVDVIIDVRDVDPVIGGIDPPQDNPEILPGVYNLDVEPGAPGDPITRIEWDFNNDNQADCVWAANGGVPANLDCAGANGTAATWSFRDAGEKTIVVKVFDQDSVTVDAINAEVREITLGELITYAGGQADAAVQNPAVPVLAKRELIGIGDDTSDGEWGERHNWRGNSLIAMDKMMSKMARAQALGADFGLELWAMSRQLVREMTRLRDAILDDDNGPGEDHRSMQRAIGYLDNLVDEFDDDDFEGDVYSDNLVRIRRAQTAWQFAYEAFFWLSDSIDPCAADGFNLDRNIDDPQERVRAATPVNDRLTEALADLSQEMTDYANSGNNDAPGRADVLRAVDVLAGIRALQQKPIPLVCPAGVDCVTDLEALTMEVDAMDLASELDAAATRGAYHRQWQSCLVEAVRFRIEVSLLRVEFVCGENSGVAQTARAAQAIGLDFYDDGLKNDAMQYYKHDDRKCLLIDTYNACLHSQFPNENPEYELPDECQPEE